MSEQNELDARVIGDRRRRRTVLVAGISALALAGAATGVALANPVETVNGTGSAARATSMLPRWNGGYGYGGYGGNSGGYGGYGNGGGYGSGNSGTGPGSGSGGGSGSGTSSAATASQQVGVVDIDTVLGYQQGEAAGTGMLVTSGGEVLTNNHVVDGATKITVTIVSSGKTYTATVVGTDPTQDVAVLQLSGASGLQTANFGDSNGVTVGAAVTGVGNAGGAGGTPTAAAGKVTALDRPITASDESGANSERLTGLIETDAQIEPGDSGGPLYDAAGKIIGMDTAAQTNGQQTTAGYAITIDHALSVAQQIESATASTNTIHLGLPAFLGVSVVTASGSSVTGAGVEQVVSGGPAAKAGILAGDVITGVDGKAIASATQLEPALTAHRPGQSVTINWTDTSGHSHHAQVTLATGPAD
ncbi:MAG: S1C family serine protease [Jatrophihabitantaceae bacterium]